MALAQESAAQAPTAYRDLPLIGSRNLVWIIAQLHLLLAGFVLGVPIFAWLCEIVGVEIRRQALRQAGEGVYQTPDLVLCDHGPVRRHSVVSSDRLLSEADDLFDRYFLPVLPSLLRAVSRGNGHALSLLVWLGRHGRGKWKEVSHFLGSPAKCLRLLHHDRAELLGDLPSQPGRACRRHRFRAGLGRDLESHLVAGQCPSTDRQRGARRLYLRRLCRHPVFVGQESRKSDTITIGWAMSATSSACSVSCRCRLPAIG